MRSFCIVGFTGTGKTTDVKKLLDKFLMMNKLIYDVNNEYTDYINEPLLTINDFVSKAKKQTNSIIVFEEATIFFSNRGYSSEVVDILVRKRHTNNMLIFVFHSLRSVPTYIFEMIDYFFIHNTNDKLIQLKKKFDNENLTQIFEIVKKNSKFDKYYTYKVKGLDL